MVPAGHSGMFILAFPCFEVESEAKDSFLLITGRAPEAAFERRLRGTNPRNRGVAGGLSAGLGKSLCSYQL